MKPLKWLLICVYFCFFFIQPFQISIQSISWKLGFARGLSPRLCLSLQRWHNYCWPWKKMSGLTAGPIFPFPLCIWLMIKALFPCMPMEYFITNNKLSTKQFHQFLVRSSWATYSNSVSFHSFFCNMRIIRVWGLKEILGKGRVQCLHTMGAQEMSATTVRNRCRPIPYSSCSSLKQLAKPCNSAHCLPRHLKCFRECWHYNLLPAVGDRLVFSCL